MERLSAHFVNNKYEIEISETSETDETNIQSPIT